MTKYPIRNPYGERKIDGAIEFSEDKLKELEAIVAEFVERGETPPPIKLEYSFVRGKNKFVDFYIKFEEATRK